MSFKAVINIDCIDNMYCSGCPMQYRTLTCFAFDKARALDSKQNDYYRLPECTEAEKKYMENANEN